MLFYPERARTFNSIGDEQKKYESNKLDYFMPYIPIIARLDGKAFHKFTKGLNRPLDSNLMECIKQTTVELCKYFQADFGYTQSDEITLIWLNPTPTKLMFNGKSEKYTSLLASVCTAHFNRLVQQYLPQKASTMAFFDARVFQVPNIQKAFENICWRQLDCIKNSISSYAYANFSPKSLIGKHSKDRKGMLFDKGIDWEAEPNENKYGIFVHKVSYIKELDTINYSLANNDKIITLDNGIRGVYRNEYRVVASCNLKDVGKAFECFFVNALFCEDPIKSDENDYYT